MLFEEYLEAHRHTDFCHEQPFPGKSKNPDYQLECGGSTMFFEIKEFEIKKSDRPLPIAEYSHYDPYKAIREKIHRAAQQLKEYKEFSCSLVLANPKELPLISLADPGVVYGAMLGNLGFRFRIGVGPSEKTFKEVFTSGGKMVGGRRLENTTISAIIFLGTFPLRDKRIKISIKERQRQLGRVTGLDEDLEFYEAIPDGPELRRVRVIVFEHPEPRIPLGRDLFCGPFDERWGSDGGIFRRVFVGDEVAAIESALE